MLSLDSSRIPIIAENRVRFESVVRSLTMSLTPLLFLMVASFAEPVVAQQTDDEIDGAKIQAICTAASRGDIVEIRSLLEEEPLLRFVVNDQGFTPIHYAAMNGKLEAVELLLIRMGDFEAGQSTYHGRPLQYAASRGHIEVVQLLIDNGADVDSRDTNHRTPLIWAVMSTKLECAEALIRAGCDVNVENVGGWTPLHYAYQAGNETMIELLVENGADTEKQNNGGKLPNEIPVRIR